MSDCPFYSFICKRFLKINTFTCLNIKLLLSTLFQAACWIDDCGCDCDVDVNLIVFTWIISFLTITILQCTEWATRGRHSSAFVAPFKVPFIHFHTVLESADVGSQLVPCHVHYVTSIHLLLMQLFHHCLQPNNDEIYIFLIYQIYWKHLQSPGLYIYIFKHEEPATCGGSAPVPHCEVLCGSVFTPCLITLLWFCGLVEANSPFFSHHTICCLAVWVASSPLGLAVCLWCWTSLICFPLVSYKYSGAAPPVDSGDTSRVQSHPSLSPTLEGRGEEWGGVLGRCPAFFPPFWSRPALGICQPFVFISCRAVALISCQCHTMWKCR